MRRLHKHVWKIRNNETFNEEEIYGNVDFFQEVREKRTKEGIVKQYTLRPHGSQKNIPVILIVK